jgi:hypothetical protein
MSVFLLCIVFLAVTAAIELCALRCWFGRRSFLSHEVCKTLTMII